MNGIDLGISSKRIKMNGNLVKLEISILKDMVQVAQSISMSTAVFMISSEMSGSILKLQLMGLIILKFILFMMTSHHLPSIQNII